METKICNKCHQELPISDFYVRSHVPKISYFSACKKCRLLYYKTYDKEHAQSYYQMNKEKLKAQQKELYYKDIEESRRKKREYAKNNPNGRGEKAKAKYKRIRLSFLSMYGGKCVCCGETTQEFLTIEHVKGQIGIKRNKKETGATAYRDAIKEYRPDMYEILCWNCNCSKGRYGYCPHHK